MSGRGPIFVVASPGSGAAVLFEILERARETVRLSDSNRIKLQRYLGGSDVSQEQAHAMRAIFRDATKGTRRAVVTSLARHHLSIPTAHAVWPNARFVYLHRDAQAHIAAAQLADASAEGWEASTRTTLDALNALPATAWCALNYTDLLVEPETEAQWLGQFLQLSWNAGRLSAGPVLKRHRAASSIEAAAQSPVSPSMIELAQRAEALQRRHHPAWVVQDVANARKPSPSRRSLERIQRVVVSGRVAAGICLATALPQAARAATYQVTNLSDSGTGSLRDAIGQANNSNGITDTITFASGAAGRLTLTSGDIKITDSVTIQGLNANTLAIDGNHASGIFYPYSKTNIIDVVISNMTLQNGSNPNSGGAISSHNANLSVEDCVVQNSNTAKLGGGIAVAGVGTNPNFSLVNTIVAGNTSSRSGGGVAIQGNVTVTVTGATISGNHSGSSGGGVYGSTGAHTTATVENSAVLDNNSTSSGGGIYFSSAGDLVVQNSNLSGNAGNYGGGLYATGGGNATVDTCTVNKNTAFYWGGGLLATGEALSVNASTIANNSALYGGGGIVTWTRRVGPVTIANSTIVGNTGPKRSGGGVIFYNPGTAGTLTNCTITGNSAKTGGGVYAYGTSTNVLIRNSIIAENTSNPNNPNQLGGRSSGMTNVAVMFSLVSDANDVLASSNPNLVIVENTNNLLGANPNLGTLGNHGGPTATLMPAPTSPVVNAGDPNQTGLSAYDQRGLTRVVEGRVDMGAVELQTCTGTTNLEGEGGCPIGGTPAGGTTTAGGSTTGSTTGSHGGGGGGGCATSPVTDNAFTASGLLAAAAGLLLRRRRRN